MKMPPLFNEYFLILKQQKTNGGDFMRYSLLFTQSAVIVFLLNLCWHTFFIAGTGPLKTIGPFIVNPYIAAFCLSCASFFLLYYLLTQLAAQLQ